MYTPIRVLMSNSKVTLKIPRNLYEKVKDLIEDTGFNSVTEFNKFVLRDIASQGKLSKENLSKDMKSIRKRLKSLGYLGKED